MSADIRAPHERPEIALERDGLLRTIASIAAEFLLEDEQPLEQIENEDSQQDNQDADARRRTDLPKTDGDPAGEAKPDSPTDDTGDVRDNAESDEREDRLESPRNDRAAATDQETDRPRAEPKADSGPDDESADPDRRDKPPESAESESESESKSESESSETAEPSESKSESDRSQGSDKSRTADSQDDPQDRHR